MEQELLTEDYAGQIVALRPYLVKIARMKLHDAHTVEDVVQETLLAALAGRSPFMGKSRLRTWVTSILHFKIIDAYRLATLDAGGRALHGAAAADHEARQDPMEVLSDSDPGQGLLEPFVEAERQQLQGHLLAAIEQLPGKWRDVFVLVQIHGLSGQDAADMMGLTRSNVWVMFHRAKKSLQGHLRTQGW